MAKIRPQWPDQLMQSGANCRLAAGCTSDCLFRCHSPKTFVLWPQSIDLELLHYTMGAICEALGVVGQLIQQGRTEGNVLSSHSPKKKEGNSHRPVVTVGWRRGCWGCWGHSVSSWPSGKTGGKYPSSRQNQQKRTKWMQKFNILPLHKLRKWFNHIATSNWWLVFIYR